MTRSAWLFWKIVLAVVLLGGSVGVHAGSDVVHGAGASFPAPLYLAWAAAYRRETGLEVDYEALGSGTGRELIVAGRVDFGATEAPLSTAELQRAGLMQFPAVIGGVVPVVNLAGIAPGELRLTGELLADIYLGKIRRWDDTAIAALNPQLQLPALNITVVHRSDASGTTWLWSRYLSWLNPQWAREVGSGMSLNWPVGSAASGNEGVAAFVQRTRASIGYVEFTYAKQHRLATARLRNHDGEFVVASRAAFEAAAASAAAPGAIAPDPAGAASWPMTGASFVLLPQREPRSARSAAVLAFFDWAFGHGQAMAIGLDYVPLDAATAGRVRADWARAPAGAADAPRP